MSPNDNGGATRPAYKVEELLALRGSASESRVSLEKFPDEDTIKEHVLKPTASNPGLLPASENIRPPPIGPAGYVPFTAYNRAAQPFHPAPFATSSAMKRPSPSPSVKRSKAERLLKEHGSPPHVRVTAGGRIVPNDLPQLGSPRLPMTPLYRSNIPSRLPLADPIGQLPAYANGFLAYDYFGKLVQFFDGRWNDVHLGINGQPNYAMAPPNLPFPAAHGFFNPPVPTVPMPVYSGQPTVLPNAMPPSVNMSFEAVPAELEHSRKEYQHIRQEKINLERHEVKAGDLMTAAERSQVVSEKRKYVLKLDAIRKRVKELEELQQTGLDATTGISNADVGTGRTKDGPYHPCGNYMNEITPDYPDGVPVLLLPHLDPYNASMLPVLGSSYAQMKPQTQPSASEKPQVETNPEPQPHHSPGSEPSPSSRAQPRRSHAIPIKDPKTQQPMTDQAASAHGLNPTSPVYQPGRPFPLARGSPPHFDVPAPNTPMETPIAPNAELAAHWTMAKNLEVDTEKQSEDRSYSDEKGDRISEEKELHAMKYHLGNNENGDYSSYHPTSHSSVTTTDFFPVNTHEHSFNKYMSRQASSHGHLSRDTVSPYTPFREHHRETISPMTEDQYRPPAVPPVSPEDMRLSSFLRDTAHMPPRLEAGKSMGHSPVRADIRDEFDGKSKAYLEGYIAASSAQAPSDPKNGEYIRGFIDGLSKLCVTTVTRESSTISLKSGTISISRTPPNTTENRSLIADLAGTQPSRHENVRLTQSLHFSSPDESYSGRTNGYTSGSNTIHMASTSLPQDKRDKNSRVTSGFTFSAQTYLPKSWSEDNTSPASANFRCSNTPTTHTSPWNVPSHLVNPVDQDNRDTPLHSQAALPSQNTAFTSNSARRGQASLISQPSLTSYSGNRTELTARVGSIPQHTLFGQDMYEQVSRRSTRELSHQSQTQYDGAMDDLAELAGSEPPPKQQNANIRPAGAAGKAPMSMTTPPVSPSKSGSSPKKLNSPRHRMQQFASRVGEKVGDMFDRGATCSNDRHERDVVRVESPDPSKMNPEEKKRWKDQWKNKLQGVRMREEVEIRKYRRENQ